MRFIYESIKNRLLNKTTITDIRLFNNQLQELDKESLFYPSILIEITDVQFNYKSAIEYQTGVCLVRLHLVEYSLHDDLLKIFDLKDMVNKALIDFTDGCSFNPIQRKSERPDTNITNIYDYIIEYEIEFMEQLDVDYNDDFEQEIILGLDLDSTIGE